MHTIDYSTYQITYNDHNAPAIIQRFDGAILPYNPQVRTFDEGSFLVQELRRWEQEFGALSLSDRPPQQESIELIPSVMVAYTSPNNSFISAENQQTATDRVIEHLQEQQSRINALAALTKPPLVSDKFNDLDNVILPVHTPDKSQGYNWVVHSGSGKILSNQLDLKGIAAIDSVSGFSKLLAEIDVTISDVSTLQGLVLHCVSATSYVRAGFMRSSSIWKLAVYEINGGSSNMRGSINLAGITPGLTHKLRATKDTNNYSLYLNDELKLSWSSSFNANSAKHGAYSSPTALLSTKFKNFNVISL